MDIDQLRDISMGLGIDIKSLKLIQENKYCLIYLAETPNGKCIVKKYRGEDPSLIRIEAEALAFYHDIARNDPDLIDSGAPVLNAEKNLLSIGFVEGSSFSDFLYKARRDEALQKRSYDYMRILGKLIRTIFEMTQQPNRDTDSIIFEYFDYSSRRLVENQLWGSILFKNYKQSAADIAENFRKAKITPSFVHGDFVFKNIHVHKDRVGLIDFANAIYLSHPLNDIYNMRMALGNMVIPKNFKTELISNFNKGFGPSEFPEIAHQFYYEYHRRRWLMLKLCWSRIEEPKLHLYHIKDWAQGLRGLATFARPYNSRIKYL